MYPITLLQKCSESQFSQLHLLMIQLSERINLQFSELQNVIDDPNAFLYVMTDGDRIIGCATLCCFHSPTGLKASIEDVVVHSDYRGRHLGRQLMTYILNQARTMAPIELHLTSKPKRVAANKLYQSLGFQRKETNFYTLTFEEGVNLIGT